MFKIATTGILATSLALTLHSGVSATPINLKYPTAHATSANTQYLNGFSSSTIPVNEAVDPLDAIERAKEDDPIAFNEKVDKLKSSPALMDLFEGVPDQQTMDTYIEFFATVSTNQQIDHFLKTTEGKHFEVIGEGNNIQVNLIDGEPTASYSCCRCWQARAVSIGYFAASQLTCIPIGILGGTISGGVGVVAGFVCSGIFYAIEQLPNFDAACPRRRR